MTCTTAILALALLAGPALAGAQAPVEIEPSELSKRKDLINREVIVDDRVKFFFPVAGRGYPVIILASTEVTVELPDRFAYSSSQSARSVRARGILRRKADGGALYIEATQAPELFRSDLDRIKAVVASMAPDDMEARSAWASWAARRAKAFDDRNLKAVADQLQAEAIALEYRKPKARTPEALLALAKKARAKQVAEPEPSAIAHMAYRLQLASIKTRVEFETLAAELRAFLPDSAIPQKAGLKLPTDAYDKDPYSTYRHAAREVRVAFDRRLWTDVVTQIYRLRAVDPKEWKRLGEEAKVQLPDRPEVGSELVSRYYEKLKEDVATLRESEMRDFARTTRDLGQPEKADALNRTWLDHQRKALGANDSEQRVELASKYLAYLKDRATTTALLREALKIDPDNREAIEQFQRMGFVRSGDTWRDPNDPASKAAAPVGDRPRPPSSDDPILGLTPTEVKAQLGEPKRVGRIATQGRVSIQWVYESAQGFQYINFVQRAGDPQPIVTGRFAVR